MVRRAEGALAQYGALFVRQTADAPDTGGLHRLLAAHVRQYAGETLGEHRFARTRRPDHEHIVPARGGDFERALDVFLSLDLGIVGEEQLFLARHGRLGGGDLLLAREMRQKLRNGMYGIDGEMVGVRRLARVAAGTYSSRMPAFSAASAIGSAPRTGRTSPERESSPITAASGGRDLACRRR